MWAPILLLLSQAPLVPRWGTSPHPDEPRRLVSDPDVSRVQLLRPLAVTVEAEDGAVEVMVEVLVEEVVGVEAVEEEATISTPPSSGSSGPPRRRSRRRRDRVLNQAEMQQQLEQILQDQQETAARRRIAGIMTTNTITTTYKDNRRPTVTRNSTSVHN